MCSLNARISVLWLFSTLMAISCGLIACTNAVQRGTTSQILACPSLSLPTGDGLILYTAVAALVSGISSLFYSRTSLTISIVVSLFCFCGQVIASAYHLVLFWALTANQTLSCQMEWIPPMVSAFALFAALCNLITICYSFVLLCRPIKNDELRLLSDKLPFFAM
ncbi:hypothetical protein Ciccas_008056 [Cichlidogyrus casuarinus]|uniref:NADH dehydrogenase subunit 6 n=1 Tax=Cichlidogyrus casuarinus TaxID=1844966 RepID=A0ABD2Q120_9PLAT